MWPRCGGLFGELLASEALRRGLGGLVVDGNCRDSGLLRQWLGLQGWFMAGPRMALPIYHRGTHPNAGTATKRGRSQVTVTMGGVKVEPGDFATWPRLRFVCC